MSDYSNEKASLARRDAALLEDLSGWLYAYAYQVDACGNDGNLELKKSQERARLAVKALVNYL
mgnify:CR=1 FL=1